MNYKGWVLAIYETYATKYENKYSKKKLKDLSFKKKIKLIVGWLLIVIGLIMDVIALVISNELLYLGGISVIAISLIIFDQMSKCNMEVFKKNLIVLEEVLIDENIDTVSIISQLIQDTGNLTYRLIKDTGKGNIYIQILSYLSASGIVAYLLNAENSKSAYLLLIIFIVIFIIYVLYSTIPYGKNQKRKTLHELLKILLVYRQCGIVLIDKPKED